MAIRENKLLTVRFLTIELFLLANTKHIRSVYLIITYSFMFSFMTVFNHYSAGVGDICAWKWSDILGKVSTHKWLFFVFFCLVVL